MTSIQPKFVDLHFLKLICFDFHDIGWIEYFIISYHLVVT